MLQNNIGRLPVVSRENPEQMVGYLNRSSILSAWTRQMEDESLREHGWLDRLLRTSVYAQSTERKTLVGQVVKIASDSLQLVFADGETVESVELSLAQPLTGIAQGDRLY
jgi:hypothetical protein